MHIQKRTKQNLVYMFFSKILKKPNREHNSTQIETNDK